MKTCWLSPAPGVTLPCAYTADKTPDARPEPPFTICSRSALTFSAFSRLGLRVKEPSWAGVEIVCTGPELDGDAAALAVAPRAAVVPPVAGELELPDEQPVSASRATVPQAATAP